MERDAEEEEEEEEDGSDDVVTETTGQLHLNDDEDDDDAATETVFSGPASDSVTAAAVINLKTGSVKARPGGGQRLIRDDDEEALARMMQPKDPKRKISVTWKATWDEKKAEEAEEAATRKRSLNFEAEVLSVSRKVGIWV